MSRPNPPRSRVTARRAVCLLLAALLPACGSTVRAGLDPAAIAAVDAGQSQDPFSVPTTDRADGLSLPSGSAPTTSSAATSSRPAGSTTPATGSQAPGAPSAPAAPGDPGIAPPPAGPTAPPPSGPAADRGPVTLGVVTTENSAASGFVDDSYLTGTMSESQLYQLLIDAINEEGGFGGRQAQVIYENTDTGSSNWEQEFARVCASFTQDHHVAAVIGYVFGHFESLEGCLSDAGTPHLTTTFATPDRTTQLRYPLMINQSSPTFERRSILKVDAGIEAGLLTGDSRLGIILEDCPIEIGAYRAIVEPHIRDRGLEIASEFTLTCGNGVADGQADLTRLNGMLLQFQAAGVDTIMLMARSEGPALYFITTAAESQRYRPTYIVSSLANANVLDVFVPEPQLRNIHGFGWLPSQDVLPPDEPPMSAAGQRCTDLYESKGVVLQANAVDRALGFGFCESVFLYEQAMGLTGGDSRGSALVPAIESIGGGFDSPLNLDGATFYSSQRHDGPERYRAFGYADDCGCFRYGSQTGPIPS